MAWLGPLTGLVRLEIARRNYRAAREYLATLERRVTPLGLTADGWRFWLVKGLYLEASGSLMAAHDALHEAARQTELIRARIDLDDIRATYAEDKNELYEALIRVGMRLRRHSDVFETIERAKARAFLDLLNQRRLTEDEASGQPQGVDIAELRLAERLLQSDIAAQRASTPTDTAAVIAQRGARATAVAERRAQALQKLSAGSGRTVEISAQPARLADIQARLRPNEVLLNYYFGRRLGVIGVLRNEGVEILSLNAPTPEKMIAFLGQLSDPTSSAWRGSSREIYDRLIKPVREHLKHGDTVFVSPHGAMHYVPIHALLDSENRFVALDFAVAYLPSASVLTQLPSRSDTLHLVALAVANPTVPGLTTLPGAEKEVQALRAVFPTRVLLGAAARKEDAVRDSPQFQILHFATHAELNADEPLESSLRLTPTDQDDGRLTVDEIFNLRLNAELAVLSACNTGVGRSSTGAALSPGDELIGLARAFLYAGARTIIATLWPVADIATADLMTEFYANLRSAPKAEALRSALVTVLTKQATTPSVSSISAEQVTHPFYWAGFIVLGDGR